MNILDSKLYEKLNTIVDFVLLNLLWLLMCLPVITIFPATAALFGVVRKWKMEKEPPLLKTYFVLFKENFIQSSLIGLIWTALGAALYLDFTLVGGNVFLQFLLLIMVSVYTIVSIYLFPVMVHYKNSVLHTIKNSFYLAILKPLNLVISLVILYCSYLLLISFPISILIIGSTTAYFIYMICLSTFQKAEKITTNVENI
ncbi:YesL family protein [Heyndrickxia sp. MSNUG]|uniref:YesL family protein n=1 Tax=Heyndrickxia sp. MSNUG TaxID=3136677 RepID=UPI003C30D49C